MTKDELKKEAEKYAEQCYGWTNNDLALDVAEATYIASAEPREKRIAELKHKLTEKVTLESLDVVSAKMNDLEKENSELKRNKKTVVHLAECLEEKQEEQLTKAKEIIKEFVRLEYADFTNGDYSNELSKVLKQAEQFLKEIEK